MNSPQERSGRIPELDGIRGIAIAMVLIWQYFHLAGAFFPAPASFFSRLLVPLRLMWSGVDLFFVLSGFLIGGILLDARGSQNYFRVFYTRRFFRIVPIYVAILVAFPLALRIAAMLRPGNYSWLTDHSLPWYSFWTFTQNFWMARRHTLGANILAVTWSLAIEEQFYLTLPFVIWIASRRAVLIAVISGILFAPVLRTALLSFDPGNAFAAMVLMPCRADALLMGVLAAILLRDQRYREKLAKSSRHFAVVFFILASGLVYLMLRSPSLLGPLMQRVGYTWMAFFYASVLVFALTFRQSLLSRLFRNRLLRWLGMLAYGIYLLHEAVQGFVFAGIWSKAPEISSFAELGGVIGSLALTVVIASLSWRYFESPLIRIGHRINYRWRESASDATISDLAPKGSAENA